MVRRVPVVGEVRRSRKKAALDGREDRERVVGLRKAAEAVIQVNDTNSFFKSIVLAKERLLLIFRWNL
jgi:hypothetical protein